MCKHTGLRILNGRWSEDKQGRYTYIGPRGSSLVDYVITCQNLKQHVGTFKVNDPNIMSDHCMVDFSLNFNIRNFDQGDEGYSSNSYINSKYVWNKSDKDVYINSLLSEHIQNDLHVLNESINHVTCSNDIDRCLADFSSIIVKAIPATCKNKCNPVHQGQC